MLGRLTSFVCALVRRRRGDREMEEEWQFHLDQRKAALVADDVPAAEAGDRARREFGDPLRWKEQGREARGLRWLHDVRSDVQYALRQIRRAPGFAAVAIATLALGIGANTAMFSIANALMLRPLPVVEPERLVAVATANDVDEAWTYAVWNEIRRRSSPFDGAFAFGRQRFDLSDRGETDPVDGIYVSGDFFTTLGVSAWIGRTFTAADDVAGGGPDGPVAVISYGTWQRRYGGAPDVLGARLVIQQVPFTIIGVTPPQFFGAEVGRTFDVALPLISERLIRGSASTLNRSSGNFALRIMLRLRPDQSIDAAAATLRALQPQIREAAVDPALPPDDQAEFLEEPFTLVSASAGISALRGQYETPLLAMLAIVATVLLITCANLANLLLARATGRRHELSVRLALGAGRWRLARQVLVESIVLAAAGATLGLLLAVWGSEALVAQLSTVDSPVMLDVGLDRRVLTFATMTACATALLFGVGPAWRGTRVTPGEILKQHGRGPIGGRAGMSSGLVVAQVALSLVLVAVSGLFIRSVVRLGSIDLGLDSDRILMVDVDVARTAIAPANRVGFFHQVIERIGALPGVAGAAASLVTPVGGGAIIDEVEVTGAAPVSEGESTFGLPRFWTVNSVMLNVVTPGWFETYGMTLGRGRSFADRDDSRAPRVAIVNEAFVRKFLHDRDPIGAAITHRIGSARGVSRTIVAVVNDSVYESLRGGVRPVLFVPLAQATLLPARTIMPISVRSAGGPPGALSPMIAEALSSLEPNVAFSFRLLQDRVDATFLYERLVALLAGFFGALAMLLTALGLYGVTAYTVARRRPEIGIRLALGADPRRVVRQVLGRVLLLIGTGAVAGVGASLWLTRFVASLLYGLEPHDPPTLAAAVLALAAVGLVAGWLPAYRASRIDPAEVLREN